MKNNLANNLMFVADVIIDTEEEPTFEVIETSLILAQYSWNNEIITNNIRPEYYQKEIKRIEKDYPQIWKQLIRKNCEDLIDILTKRKKVFFPNDNMFIKNFFINMLETITVDKTTFDKMLEI